MSGSTSKNAKNISPSNNSMDMDKPQDETIGQGELYSPNYAIKITNNNNKGEEKDTTNNIMVMGRGDHIRTRMGIVKDKVLEKLAAASVPSDVLENSRSFLENMIRDVTSKAQGITMEALHRIKSHLADILPSLSPSITSKMVDDAEKEAVGIENEKRGDKEMKDEISDNEHHQKEKTVSRL